MMAGGMGMTPPPRMGTADAPVGAPPSIVSADQGFGQPGTLPSPDPSLIAQPQVSGGGCSACGAPLRENAKFCTKCGTKANSIINPVLFHTLCKTFDAEIFTPHSEQNFTSEPVSVSWFPYIPELLTAPVGV